MSELSESLSSTVMSPDAWRGMVTVLLLVSTVYPLELEVGVALSCVTISPALESVVAVGSGSAAVGVARAASTGMLTMATSRGASEFSSLAPGSLCSESSGMCGEMWQGEVRRCCGSRCAGAVSAPQLPMGSTYLPLYQIVFSLTSSVCRPLVAAARNLHPGRLS